MNVAVRNRFNSDPERVRRINLNISKASNELKELGILDPGCLDGILTHVQKFMDELLKH